MNELKIVATNDGSSTIFSEKYNQQYHSLHGALQESMHVFIQAGLQFKQTNLNHSSEAMGNRSSSSKLPYK